MLPTITNTEFVNHLHEMTPTNDNQPAPQTAESKKLREHLLRATGEKITAEHYAHHLCNLIGYPLVHYPQPPTTLPQPTPTHRRRRTRIPHPPTHLQDPQRLLHSRRQYLQLHPQEKALHQHHPKNRIPARNPRHTLPHHHRPQPHPRTPHPHQLPTHPHLEPL